MLTYVLENGIEATIGRNKRWKKIEKHERFFQLDSLSGEKYVRIQEIT